MIARTKQCRRMMQLLLVHHEQQSSHISSVIHFLILSWTKLFFFSFYFSDFLLQQILLASLRRIRGFSRFHSSLVKEKRSKFESEVRMTRTVKSKIKRNQTGCLQINILFIILNRFPYCTLLDWVSSLLQHIQISWDLCPRCLQQQFQQTINSQSIPQILR